MIKINKEQSKQDRAFISKIRKKVSKTMLQYQMLAPNNRLLLAFSGGKDSIVLADILKHIQSIVPFSFELHAIMVGNEYAENTERIQQQLSPISLKIIHFETQVLEEKKPKTASYCQICSRIRRGSIYEYASKNQYDKILLGHHLDDVIETFFLNQFYQAKLETMKPRFLSDDQRNQVIRPLHAILEHEIQRYFNLMAFDLLKADCPFQITKSKRSDLKELLMGFSDMEKYNIYHSLKMLF